LEPVELEVEILPLQLLGLILLLVLLLPRAVVEERQIGGRLQLHQMAVLVGVVMQTRPVQSM